MDNLGLLLASNDIWRAIADHEYGVVLRWVRQARGLTQAQVGQRAGYSAATISRFETGARRLSDIDTLRHLAVALEVSPQAFGLTSPDSPGFPAAGRAASPPNRLQLTTVVTGLLQDGDDVRRRELLTGLAGVSAAAMLPMPQVTRTTNTDRVVVSLEQILAGGSPSSAPVASEGLAVRLASGRRAFGACRYQDLAARLPSLVNAAANSRDAASGTAREAFSAVLSGAYVLAAELAQKAGEDGMSWVAADRAVAAARDSGDPTAIAAASRAVAIAMRRSGHYDAATTMLSSAALSLGAEHGTSSAPVLAAYGSLLCTAAYASAQNRQRGRALEFVGEAASAAARSGPAPGPDGVFSASVVKGYQISIHIALGDSAAALAHARAVIQPQLPTAERYARFCIDTARAWQQHGRPDQACRALLAAERHSPEEVRRPSVRTLITAMLAAPGRSPSGLRQLADRAGVLA
jgi:transcriptional regulator with XRE-family HTH domain